MLFLVLATALSICLYNVYVCQWSLGILKGTDSMHTRDYRWLVRWDDHDGGDDVHYDYGCGCAR